MTTVSGCCCPSREKVNTCRPRAVFYEAWIDSDRYLFRTGGYLKQYGTKTEQDRFDDDLELREVCLVETGVFDREKKRENLRNDEPAGGCDMRKAGLQRILKLCG
jgi:hypothetical protein